MADQTQGDTTIDASAADIMAVIEDFEEYPQWVDHLKSAEVLSVADGHPRQVKMRLEHPLIKDTYTLTYEWAEQGVSWSLVEGQKLTAMDGSYTLSSAGAKTKVTYALAVDVAIPMLGMLRRKAEKAIIDGALSGLKKRVEGQSA